MIHAHTHPTRANARRQRRRARAHAKKHVQEALRYQIKKGHGFREATSFSCSANLSVDSVLDAVLVPPSRWERDARLACDETDPDETDPVPLCLFWRANEGAWSPNKLWGMTCICSFVVTKVRVEIIASYRLGLVSAGPKAPVPCLRKRDLQAVDLQYVQKSDPKRCKNGLLPRNTHGSQFTPVRDHLGSLLFHVDLALLVFGKPSKDEEGQ